MSNAFTKEAGRTPRDRTMTKRRPPQRDPLEAAIEAALQPRRFIAYGAGWDFVSNLEEVAGQLEKLVRTDPERAADLYETFLAGCYEKADELDDSSGNFGMFVDSLYCGWIRARQAAGSNADETARLLLDRMENDPYSFAYTLERDAVTVLNKDGLAAFERQVRARFDAKDAAERASDRTPRRDPAYARRRWAEVLRAIYAQQRDVPAYVALCERSELSAQDCLVVATMLKTRRKREEALAWVDRGLALEKGHPHGSMAGHDLAKLKRELLTKLGRSRDALEEAWVEFREDPSTFGYEELMRFVPKAERPAWHAKAMDAAERADLGSLIELWLKTREIERLVARLRTATDAEIEDLSHYRTEPAAIATVEVDPLREGRGRLDVDARHLLVADAAGLFRVHRRPQGPVTVEEHGGEAVPVELRGPLPAGGDSLQQVPRHPAPVGLLEALNTVRKQEFKRAGKAMKGLLCGKKFILLSRQAHVRGKARVALTQLLGRNRRLLKAHLLKESFGHLWSSTSKTWARKFFTQWVAQLKWSRLAPSHEFARMVETHLDGILAYCDKPVSLGCIEGTNLKARNIIRRAYGYRDKEYMKLKIIQVCSSLGTFRPYGIDPDNSS